MEANPDMDPARVRVGQKIFIPASETQKETDGANGGWDNER